MKKHSVIIDCDTGTDDAVAIIAALGSEELDIRAITTVCGNVDLAYTAANTLNLVRMLGFDTPVARGAESVGQGGSGRFWNPRSDRHGECAAVGKQRFFL